MGFSLIGTGSATPSRTVTNDELSRLVDTSDAWIRTRTGVRERHVLTDENLSDLVFRAGSAALLDAGVQAGELDLILCSTVRNDFMTPSMACTLQKALGATCIGMDINAACSGFLYALDVAVSYFARGRVKKVLVVAAEAMSRLADWRDRATCVLFGDGAGAVVLTEGDGLRSIRVTASGNTELLTIANVQGNCPFTKSAPRDPFLYMNGPEVFKFAVSSMCQDLAFVIAEAGLKPEQIDYVLPHQANIRIIEAAKARLGIPDERFLCNMDRYGNTSSASIPILMDECNRAGRFKTGDLLALSAFGGGLTTGACVLRWGK
ncbi:MAG: beta-ketoacyl-ACP synthase III [Bacillota bacterium]